MRQSEERIFKFLMFLSVGIVMASLITIIIVNLVKGGSVIINSPEVLVEPPGSRYLLGGEGGFLHAVLGSLCMVIPATIIASIISFFVAIFLQTDYLKKKVSEIIRISLDILWGTPSIVYGVFILIILIFLNQRGSMLAGIIALTLLEIPIITRYADEAISSVPKELKENAYSMGLTRLEVSLIVGKYAFSGIVAGILMGMGRAIGDAASIIFTTGAGNSMPEGLLQSATALPVLIFQQANSFYPSVRKHAYAAAFVLIVIILILNILSRTLQRTFSKYV